MPGGFLALWTPISPDCSLQTCSYQNRFILLSRARSTQGCRCADRNINLKGSPNLAAPIDQFFASSNSFFKEAN